MAIQDDWTLNYSTKKISHTAGSTRYSVNAMYSWLMDLVDDAAQMDDTVPMRANTPTEYELINGWTFNADSDLGYLTGGAIKVNATDDLWANFYNLGSLKAGAVIYIEQNQTLVASPPGYTNGDIDVLVKVRAAAADVNSRKVSFFSRDLGDRYDNFEIQAPTTGGRNPVPLSTEDDINDDATGASVAGVTIAFGTASKDIGDGAGAQNYDAVIDGGGNSVINVYRRLKYLTRRENSTDIDNPENTTDGRFYLAASGSYSQVKAAPFGSFAGGKFFGARGIWLENVSDSNNLVLIDAAGTTRTPPVTVASRRPCAGGPRRRIWRHQQGAVHAQRRARCRRDRGGQRGAGRRHSRHRRPAHRRRAAHLHRHQPAGQAVHRRFARPDRGRRRIALSAVHRRPGRGRQHDKVLRLLGRLRHRGARAQEGHPALREHRHRDHGRRRGERDPHR
jgi:hypothetical protein